MTKYQENLVRFIDLAIMDGRIEEDGLSVKKVQEMARQYGLPITVEEAIEIVDRF